MSRFRGGRTICEECRSLDIRSLQREGRLATSQSFSVSWIVGNEPAGNITVQTRHNEVVLIFAAKDRKTNSWKHIEQRVAVTWTACPMGGERPWFVCAAKSAGKPCGRRAAKIYLGGSPFFACRHCLDLTYASQLERIGYRGVGQAMKIRMKLGGRADLFDPFPSKPKGLHWKTYQRLKQMHDTAQKRFF
jgi:hypothetical protein